MARRYRRRYRRKNSFLDEAAGILGLLGIAVVYTKIKELHDANSQLLPVAIAGVILLIGLIASFVIYRFIRNQRIRRSFTIADIDAMDGVKFEYYLADVLRKRGYKDVKVTEKYDLGIDIIAKRDGVKWGIQAKRYNSMVKVAAVRQAYTALSHYGCDRAMVVSNSTYSRPAQTLAQETKTVLVDRTQLAEWVYEVSKK